MRVLHVMPSLARTFGGPVEALIGYVAAGAVHGMSAAIVAPRCLAEDHAVLRGAVPDATIDTVGPRRGPEWVAARAVAARVRAMRQEVDVVHAHGLFSPVAAAGARAALTCGLPLVIGPFGTLSPYTVAHRRVQLKRWYWRLVDGPHLERADAVHFTTERERDEAALLGADFGTRAYVVPPPVRRAMPIRGRRRRGDGAPATVLFLSRLDRKKGLDVLLDAWPLIRARRAGVRLVVAGAGEGRYARAMRARGARLGEDVAFVGFVSGAAKERCLAEAAVAVLPSHHESFGIAVVDALAAGVPVVVTPEVALSGMVAAEGLGVVAERTAAAIADAVAGALANDVLQARVASHGASVVARHFGLAAVAPALAAMYEGAVARAGGRSTTVAESRR